METVKLCQQAANNTKERFTNSPDLIQSPLEAIVNAMEAHTAMNTQALGSEIVSRRIKDFLLRPAKIYEELRIELSGPNVWV